MTRNIMTGEGVKPVEAVTEFEVSGIKLFTHLDDWGDWRATEYSSGFSVGFGSDNEDGAMGVSKAIIANHGPDRMRMKIAMMIARCGVANEEGKV